MKELLIRARTRGLKLIDKKFLREASRFLLEELLEIQNYSLGLRLVRAGEMARINARYLNHEGSTDVITFDYKEYELEKNALVSGEIYICLDDAIRQAEEFQTEWTSEIFRYLIHGILHLTGFDDLEPKKRQIMKREEKKRLKQLAAKFSFAALSAS